eukprot:6383721-Amphidinium_carterae.1
MPKKTLLKGETAIILKDMHVMIDDTCPNVTIANATHSALLESIVCNLEKPIHLSTSSCQERRENSSQSHQNALSKLHKSSSKLCA